MSTADQSGRGGEQAAENTKDFFKKAGDFSEGLRKDINAFADNIVGSKSGTHSNTADRDREYTTGYTGSTGSSGVTGMHAGSGVHPTTTSEGPLGGAHREHQGAGGNVTGSHTSSGIHPDAERTGEGLANAAERAGEKLSGNSHQTSTGAGAGYTR
ncbi:Hypothetical predicted protein [Lecanosticta acicola]|uniref:Uncharacterized protein n=1 Tax=Lecanosticta acicola TaxID=111012 RepID=A0AAI8YTP2_9PEZI|nr:Hypothetical predicted protein [Lecanosticta acicola]